MRSGQATLAAWLALVGAATADDGGARPDAKQVLQQVLHDVLTNPDLKFARDNYGTPGGRNVGLVRESSVAWPEEWRPTVPGYEVRFRSGKTPILDFLYDRVPGGDRAVSYIRCRTPRLLGVQLNTCKLDPDLAYDEQICVTPFNIGGDGGESPIIGGCLVYYTLKRVEGKWTAKYASQLDP